MPLASDVPQISLLTLRFFRRIVRRYFRRHFRAVQVQGGDVLRGLNGPLIVFGNHSSWWDPMLIVLLAEKLMPGQKHYAPIDARALEQYPILGKLGIFPVEVGSPRGAAQFLQTAEAILANDGVLWMTPQGRFSDPREMPLTFRPGLGALATRCPTVPMIPLAVEYTFWDERLPEALLHFGEEQTVAADTSTAAVTRQLEDALAKAMMALQTAAIARNPAAFETMLAGGRGTGGAYALIRRLGAAVTGRRVRLDHTQRDRA